MTKPLESFQKSSTKHIHNLSITKIKATSSNPTPKKSPPRILQKQANNIHFFYCTFYIHIFHSHYDAQKKRKLFVMKFIMWHSIAIMSFLRAFYGYKIRSFYTHSIYSSKYISFLWRHMHWMERVEKTHEKRRSLIDYLVHIYIFFHFMIFFFFFLI